MYSLVLMAAMTPSSPPLAIAPPVEIVNDKKKDTTDWDRPPGFKSPAPRSHHDPDHLVPTAPPVFVVPQSYGCNGYAAPVMSYGCNGYSSAPSYGGSYSSARERRVGRFFGRFFRRGGCY